MIEADVLPYIYIYNKYILYIYIHIYMIFFFPLWKVSTVHQVLAKDSLRKEHDRDFIRECLELQAVRDAQGTEGNEFNNQSGRDYRATG